MCVVCVDVCYEKKTEDGGQRYMLLHQIRQKDTKYVIEREKCYKVYYKRINR